MTKDEEDDFGFSHVDEDDLKQDNTDFEEAQRLIFEFLDKLAGDYDKDVIKWPGQVRHKQIDAFKDKLKLLFA